MLTTHNRAAVAQPADTRLLPATITQQYLDESTDPQTIAAIVVITMLSSLVVTCRIFTRIVITKHIGVDDSLAIVGLVMFIAFVILSLLLIRLGSGRHFEYIKYIMASETVFTTQRLDFYAHLFYTTALLICRLSALAFYWHICRFHKEFSNAIRVVRIIIILAYIPQMLLIIFHCRPVTSLWPYSFQPESKLYKCLEWGLIYCVNSGVSVVSDFLIFGIPVAMIRMINLQRKRKVQLGLIVLPGILVIAISLARLILVIKGQWESDMSWAYNPQLAVEVAEVGSTLISLSIPGIKPLVDRLFLWKALKNTQMNDSKAVPLRRAQQNTWQAVTSHQNIVQHKKDTITLTSTEDATSDVLSEQLGPSHIVVTRLSFNNSEGQKELVHQKA